MMGLLFVSDWYCVSVGCLFLHGSWFLLSSPSLPIFLTALSQSWVILSNLWFFIFSLVATCVCQFFCFVALRVCFLIVGWDGTEYWVSSQCFEWALPTRLSFCVLSCSFVFVPVEPRMVLILSDSFWKEKINSWSNWESIWMCLNCLWSVTKGMLHIRVSFFLNLIWTITRSKNANESEMHFEILQVRLVTSSTLIKKVMCFYIFHAQRWSCWFLVILLRW